VLVSIWHDVLERPSLRLVEIFCERLYVAVQGDWFGPVRWQRVGETEHELQGDALIAEGQRRGLELGNPDGLFVEAVAAGRPAYPGFAEAVVAHEVADAVYRSAATGGTPSVVQGRRTTLP
jgi:predicted dehydrogenase